MFINSYLSCFPFLVIVNKDAMNTIVQIFVGDVFIPLGQIDRSEITGSLG